MVACQTEEQRQAAAYVLALGAPQLLKMLAGEAEEVGREYRQGVHGGRA
jgi:hypothetical protein